MKPDVIASSKHFVIKVGVGLLTPGHVMIIPKEHISCFGALPDSLWEEYTQLKEQLVSEVTTHFATPIVYEHGIYQQSVPHAHMHIVPSKSDRFHVQDVHNQFFTQLPRTQMIQDSELVPLFNKHGHYVYLEQNGKREFCHAVEASFTFRQEFGKTTGLTHANRWQELSEESKHQDHHFREHTKKVLRTAL